MITFLYIYFYSTFVLWLVRFSIKVKRQLPQLIATAKAWVNIKQTPEAAAIDPLEEIAAMKSRIATLQREKSMLEAAVETLTLERDSWKEQYWAVIGDQ